MNDALYSFVIVCLAGLALLGGPVWPVVLCFVLGALATIVGSLRGDRRQMRRQQCLRIAQKPQSYLAQHR